MVKIKKRLLEIKLPPSKSAFLWGPRKVGKSYWISQHCPDAILIDLLKSNQFAEFNSRPSLLRERYEKTKKLIVIDEVQKAPALLDEVHWLIANRGISFILTGSSARKLRRGHANLLGGRAWRRSMTPLSFMEIEGFDLEKAMISGFLPPHILSLDPIEELRAYISDYLKEEVASEALVQNIPAFSEFLKVAALTSSDLLNYVNIARETGVSHKVVRNYFSILEDTYLGYRVPPWKKSRTRRMILTEKFYLFDVGVANFLAKRRPLLGGADFGKSLEHFILMELKSYQAYKNPELELTFWRSAAGQEVDFIVGDKDLAIEVKAGKVHEGDLRALTALSNDGPVRKRVVVCLENEPRILGSGIEILPWQMFLKRLWQGDFRV